MGAVVSKLSPLTVTYRGDEPDIESNYKVMDKSVDELLKEYGANSIEYRKAPNSPN